MSPSHRFQSFIDDLAAGVFKGALVTDDDTLRAFLTNDILDVRTASRKASLVEIPAGNGYSVGGYDTQNAAIRTGGEIAVTGANFAIVAKGGPIGPFRSLVLYDDSVEGDPLICWWSYDEKGLTLKDGESLSVSFGDAMFVVK